MCADAPLCAVARLILERGAVCLQDAVNNYKAAGGRSYAHSTRFLEHLLRHFLPLSAFSGARKLGWMLFERTDLFSVLARLLQRIRVLEEITLHVQLIKYKKLLTTKENIKISSE